MNELMWVGSMLLAFVAFLAASAEENDGPRGTKLAGIVCAVTWLVVLGVLIGRRL